MEEQDNLDIRQMEVTDIIADDPNESGIRKMKTGFRHILGAIYPCKAVNFVYRHIFKSPLHLRRNKYADRS